MRTFRVALLGLLIAASGCAKAKFGGKGDKQLKHSALGGNDKELQQGSDAADGDAPLADVPAGDSDVPIGNGNAVPGQADGTGDGEGGDPGNTSLMTTDDTGKPSVVTSDAGSMANGKRVRVPLVQGEQNVRAEQCTGSFVGGYCSAAYVVTISFPKPFKGVPKVLVGAAITSNQGGDVGFATDRLVAFADKVTDSSFRMVCSGSPEFGPYEGWNSIASCSWLAIGEGEDEATERLVAEGKSQITSNDCASGVGGYCASPYTKEIEFEKPFETPPKVLVTVANIADQGSDVGGATDHYQAYATNITTTGFTMVCSGSPVRGDIGKYEGWYAVGTCGYLAVGVEAGDSASRIEGAQNVTSNKCEGGNFGGYCGAGYYSHVKFKQKFEQPPAVSVSAAVVSQQGGDIGGATDKVVAYPTDITSEGFTMWCSGSPKHGTNQYEGRYSVGACSWMAVGGAKAK